MSMAAKLAAWAHRTWQTRNPISYLLYPASLITAAIVRRKRVRYQSQQELAYRSPCPVIVVGNIVVGGTGKTPVVIAICHYLQSQGWTPGIISRGYGVHIDPLQPRHAQHHAQAQDIGDEPALLTQATGAPICVHPKRALAARSLLEHYPEVNVIIADDGMQHLALARDIQIAVQDQRGVGNGWLLPAGPLRDQAQRLQEVDWLITQLGTNTPLPHTPRPPDALRNIVMRLHPVRVRQLHGTLSFSWPQWLLHSQGKRIAALAAIGQPQRFFHMLQTAGVTLQQTRALADHAVITQHSFAGLETDYILLTAKDAVKYTAGHDPRLYIVEVDAEFSHANWLHDLNQSVQFHHQRLLGSGL